MAVNYETHGKRVVDAVLAGFALLACAPIFLAVATAIALESGRPILFVQSRAGQGDRPFDLLKFRSMKVGTPSVESSEVNPLAVTRVGRVIRRLNLDELPQLLNVVRGEMSLVGPRPALRSQEELLDLRRAGGATQVKPGLTGLAQVNSYDDMSVPVKARFDNRYAGNVTCAGDFKILMKTIVYLLQPPPVY